MGKPFGRWMAEKPSENFQEYESTFVVSDIFRQIFSANIK